MRARVFMPLFSMMLALLVSSCAPVVDEVPKKNAPTSNQHTGPDILAEGTRQAELRLVPLEWGAVGTPDAAVATFTFRKTTRDLPLPVSTSDRILQLLERAHWVELSGASHFSLPPVYLDLYAKSESVARAYLWLASECPYVELRIGQYHIKSSDVGLAWNLFVAIDR